MKEYYSQITELNDSNFKPIPYILYCENESNCQESCEICVTADMICKNKCDSLDLCKNKEYSCNKSYRDCKESFEQVRKNILSMFKKIPENINNMTEKEKAGIFGCSITDYAWTKDVEQQFWEHENHKEFVDELSNFGKYPGFELGIFKLNCEPCLLTE